MTDPTPDPIDALYVALGARIKAARIARGWIQLRLADAVGLGRSSIANMEGGRQHPAVHQLAAVAQALRVDVEALLVGPLPDLTADLPEPTARLRLKLQAARREIDGLLGALVGIDPEGDPS